MQSHSSACSDVCIGGREWNFAPFAIGVALFVMMGAVTDLYERRSGAQVQDCARSRTRIAALIFTTLAHFGLPHCWHRLRDQLGTERIRAPTLVRRFHYANTI